MKPLHAILASLFVVLTVLAFLIILLKNPSKEAEYLAFATFVVSPIITLMLLKAGERQ